MLRLKNEMEIISLQHTSKVVYDKFSLGFSSSEDDLLLDNQFHQKNQFSITLQEYQLSKEWVIWLSCDLFAELQFDDAWLIFSSAEKAEVENVFDVLKTRLPEVFHQNAPHLFRRYFYRIIDELEMESTKLKDLSVVA